MLVDVGLLKLCVIGLGDVVVIGCVCIVVFLVIGLGSIIVD